MLRPIHIAGLPVQFSCGDVGEPLGEAYSVPMLVGRSYKCAI